MMVQRSRVVLIGGSGFLGSAIRTRAESMHVEVIVAGRVHPGSNTHPWDVTDLADSRRAISELRPDVVVNLAASGVSRGTADPRTMDAVNALGPANLVEAISTSPFPPRLIHAASSRELDVSAGSRDLNGYGVSKAKGTNIVLSALREGSTSGCVLRIHSAYGAGQPADRFVAWMVQRVLNEQSIELNEPERALDFVHVTDVAEAFARAVLRTETSDVILDIGSGHATTVRKVTEIAMRAAKVSPSLLVNVVGSNVRPLGWSSPPADTAAARRCLGWKPRVNLADGLRSLVLGRA